MTGVNFIAEPPSSPEVQALYDEDVDDDGYVMNLTRLWAHLPGSQAALSAVMDRMIEAAGLSVRQRGTLIAACASAMGDAYCSLGWGNKLARMSGGPVAAGVLRGDDEGLSPTDRALARWARRVATDPNATTADDVDELRDAGFDDRQVFAITTFVALRGAFSTVNDALGAPPDRELVDAAKPEVLAAVTFGRPPG